MSLSGLVPFIIINCLLIDLYGFAQSELLPTDQYRWLKKKEYKGIDWKNVNTEDDTGMILEVDLEYAPWLHHSHNSFIMAPEQRTIHYDDLSPYSQGTSIVFLQTLSLVCMRLMWASRWACVGLLLRRRLDIAVASASPSAWRWPHGRCGGNHGQRTWRRSASATSPRHHRRLDAGPTVTAEGINVHAHTFTATTKL